MKGFLSKVRNIFVYCGLSKEEYLEVQKDAYISNFSVWKYLHLLITLFFSIALISDVAGNVGFNLSNPLRQIIIGYSLISSILFFRVYRPDSLCAQFHIYLTMILLLSMGLWASMAQPDQMAVTFTVLLVLLPVFMIDKPFYMGIVLVLATVVNIFHAKAFKSPDIFLKDVMNLCIYALMGIIINTFYNCMRVREFKLLHQQRNNLASLSNSKEHADQLNTMLQHMSDNVVDILGDVVESRDTGSGKHIQRVKGFTYLLANQVMQDLPEYNLDKYTVNLITSAAALHDVGKIAISDTILLKPGKLTAEEFEVMKTHCVKGCDVIRKMAGSWDTDYLNMGMMICRSHHEKWDGRGYPQGLAGDDIPIAAQIVSVADCYDALTSDRPYKAAYPPSKAFEMITGGECGAFSPKLMACFAKCRPQFEAHAVHPDDLKIEAREYEITARHGGGAESIVVGLHDEDHNLKEKNRLDEEVSVLSSLSETFAYIAYVDMKANDVFRFKADERFEQILNSFGEIASNKRFDLLLNTIIVSEDYEDFRKITSREESIALIREKGFLSTDFRIRLDDGVHYCRMRIAPEPHNENLMLLGISIRDEEHRREAEYISLQQELENARREMESRNQLEDRLAVINCITGDYDYVCTLNAETMAVQVYRAEEWICDMFKNLEDIVTSPEARDATLKGIIYPDDFEEFKEASRHENVMKALMRFGGYTVNYRAYKYGKLVNYQTRYTLDPNNPKRIIIGLHCV